MPQRDARGVRTVVVTETPNETPKMQAALARAIPAEWLDVSAVARPRAVEADDVIIRVEACGICGTDLHILDGASYRPTVPFVLGHEPVGTVVETGTAGRSWQDRRVTLTLFTGDGVCPQCRQGDERLCPHLVSVTGVLAAWGGYAEYVLVHASQLVAVPDALSPSVAASLVDCGATAANAVRVATERRLVRALVLGAGPIGYMVAELLRLGGVEVQIVQHSALRRAALASIGHDVVASVEETSGAFDAVIDCTGAPAVMAGGLGALAPQGIYVLAGYARVPDLDFAIVARKELTIRGTRSGRREDLERVLELTASGQMRLPGIQEWPLSQVNVALAALRAKRVQGKAVIVPDAILAERSS